MYLSVEVGRSITRLTGVNQLLGTLRLKLLLRTLTVLSTTWMIFRVMWVVFCQLMALASPSVSQAFRQRAKSMTDNTVSQSVNQSVSIFQLVGQLVSHSVS